MHGMVIGHNDLAMAPVRMVTHPSSIWACGCLTLVINHETLAPNYQDSNHLLLLNTRPFVHATVIRFNRL